MKRITIGVVAVLVVVALVLGGVTAMAAKPQSSGSGKDVIAMSNGFPSGPHFNLNIHGKKWETCEAVSEDGWGSSIFIPEYGTATIQYVSNKKWTGNELRVLDPCGGFNGPKDVAKVQLPYKIEYDGAIIPAEGYFVFARILAKPNNGKNAGDPSSIILYPNVVVEACNWNSSAESEENFGGHTNCSQAVWPLGLIIGNNVYVPDPPNATFVRFDPGVTNGKGKSKAQDITRLFTYSGWVVDSSLDIGSLNISTDSCEAVPDGLLTDCDVPTDAWDIINNTVGYSAADYDPHVHTYANCGQTITWGNVTPNGVIDIEEWLAFNEDLWLDGVGGAVPVNYYCETWILDIADLVVTEQPVSNDGAKLLQVRFYPVATTEYIAPE